jgi:Fe-S cluster biosynthesis and repair protein YggX
MKQEKQTVIVDETNWKEKEEEERKKLESKHLTILVVLSRESCT